MPPPGSPTGISPTGIEAVYLANRDKLVRFLLARGAGDAAEDLVHEVWLKVAKRLDGPIGNPLAYLYRAADTAMIDRYRARRQAERRDHDWLDGQGEANEAVDPPPDRIVAARQAAAHVDATLAALPPRAASIFRRSRIDGVPQRQIAAEMGISLSTVESDLRVACRAVFDLKERLR